MPSVQFVMVFFMFRSRQTSLFYYLAYRTYHVIWPHFLCRDANAVITIVPLSCELLQMLGVPNLFSCYFILGCLFYQSQQYNPVTMQKNNENFWKCAVGSLIFFCTPALRCLPGEWVVRLETQLAKILISTQSRKHMKLIYLVSAKQSVSFIHFLSLSLSLTICLLSQSGFVSTTNISIFFAWRPFEKTNSIHS